MSETAFLASLQMERCRKRCFCVLSKGSEKENNVTGLFRRESINGNNVVTTKQSILTTETAFPHCSSSKSIKLPRIYKRKSAWCCRVVHALRLPTNGTPRATYLLSCGRSHFSLPTPSIPHSSFILRALLVPTSSRSRSYYEHAS